MVYSAAVGDMKPRIPVMPQGFERETEGERETTKNLSPNGTYKHALCGIDFY